MDCCLYGLPLAHTGLNHNLLIGQVIIALLGIRPCVKPDGNLGGFLDGCH